MKWDEAIAQAVAAYVGEPVTYREALEVFPSNAEAARGMMAEEPGLKYGAAIRRVQRYKAAPGRQRRVPSRHSAASLRMAATRILAPGRAERLRRNGAVLNFDGEITVWSGGTPDTRRRRIYPGVRLTGRRHREALPGVAMTGAFIGDALDASLRGDANAAEIWQRVFIEAYGGGLESQKVEIGDVTELWLAPR